MSGSSLLLIGRMIAGASLIAFALPAAAAEPAPPAQIEVANKIVASSDGGGSGGKGEKLICRRFDNSASRMKSIRACYTKEQWKQFDESR